MLADFGVAGLLPAPSFFRSFLSAFLVSSVLAVVLSRVSPAAFDLDRLDSEISRIDEPTTDGGTDRARTTGPEEVRE